MYAVLGEDASDGEMLKVLIRRLLGDETVRVKPKGFDGCGELLRKGAKQLQLFQRLGFQRFIICYDADGPEPSHRREQIIQRVVRPSGIGSHCVVVPVQEIEAWILADIEAVTQVFPSWRPRRVEEPPESIQNPKERLEWLSRASNKKPVYSHATHNPIVAKHLNLAVVRARCPSFAPLAEYCGR